MEINICALVFMAGWYALVVSSTCHPMLYLWDRYWRRSKVTHKSTQGDKRNVALKEGQTIVAVVDTKTGMCFYIDTDVREGKNYEEHSSDLP